MEGRSFAWLAALGAAGCYTSSQGQAPDPTQLYFPTALEVSAGRSALYLANSDFDLLYSGGTVQVFDARKIRQAVRPIADALASREAQSAACARAGLAPNGDPFLTPGPCTPLPVPPFLAGAVDVGAFASHLTLTYDPAAGGARLWAPVRGDPSLTFFDVDDDRKAAVAAAPAFRLACNAGSDGFCGDDHRVGRNPSRNLRGLQLPPDPTGIAASSDGQAIVSAHQTQQAASVVVSPWGAQPYLSYYLTSLPSGPSEVASVPTPAVAPLAAAAAQAGGYAFNHHDAFLVSYQGATEIDVLDYVPDSGSIPPRPFVVLAQQVALTISASNADTRGIAVVDSARRACQASCAGTADQAAIDCNAACAEQVPLKIYAASRTPASLLSGQIRTFVSREPVSVGGSIQTRVTGVFDSLEMHESKPLDVGVSQVKVGQIVDRDGNLADRVFVVAFDSREVFIIDPETDAIEAIVKTGRGPQDVAIDSGVENGKSYSLLYIAHFTDSYLGVAELNQTRPINYGQMMASFGAPQRPVEEQPM